MSDSNKPTEPTQAEETKRIGLVELFMTWYLNTIKSTALRILLPLGVTIALIWWFPIKDIFTLFFGIVLVPLVILMCFGLITSEVYNSQKDKALSFKDDLKTMVDVLKNIQSEQERQKAILDAQQSKA